MSNFADFLSYLRAEDMMRFYNVLTNTKMMSNNAIDSDYYYLRCFRAENYNREDIFDKVVSDSCYIDFTKKEILRRFGYDKLFQIKRGLGLFIEYYISMFYVLEVNQNERSARAKAWDFLVEGEKVDLKVSLFRKAKFNRNNSIYNVEVVVGEDRYKLLIQAIADQNRERTKQIMKELYNELLEELRKEKRLESWQAI